MRQTPKVIWLTGLPGSGKTVLANGLNIKLRQLGFSSVVLDENEMANGLNLDLMVSPSNQKELTRRLGEVALLMQRAGHIVIVSSVSPYRLDRDTIANKIGKINFLEIFLDCDLEVCRERIMDRLKGSLKVLEDFNYSLLDLDYEISSHPDIHLYTDQELLDQSLKKLVNYIVPELNSEGRDCDFIDYTFLIV